MFVKKYLHSGLKARVRFGDVMDVFLNGEHLATFEVNSAVVGIYDHTKKWQPEYTATFNVSDPCFGDSMRAYGEGLLARGKWQQRNG